MSHVGMFTMLCMSTNMWLDIAGTAELPFCHTGFQVASLLFMFGHMCHMSQLIQYGY